MELARPLKFRGVPWIGGKHRKCLWLLPLLNIGRPVRTYIEPFFGGGAVLFRRQPAPCEWANDGDGQVINFWREVKKNAPAVISLCDKILCHQQEHAEAKRIYSAGETGARAAAYFLFNLQLAFGGGIGGAFGLDININRATTFRNKAAVLRVAMERLRCVSFFNLDILDFLSKINNNKKRAAWRNGAALLYLDPPYLNSLGDDFYSAKMTEESHKQMLEICQDLAKTKGWHIAISNYQNKIYSQALAGWRVDSLDTNTTLMQKGSQPRREVLWRSWEKPRRQLLSKT